MGAEAAAHLLALQDSAELPQVLEEQAASEDEQQQGLVHHLGPEVLLRLMVGEVEKKVELVLEVQQQRAEEAPEVSAWAPAAAEHLSKEEEEEQHVQEEQAVPLLLRFLFFQEPEVPLEEHESSAEAASAAPEVLLLKTWVAAAAVAAVATAELADSFSARAPPEFGSPSARSRVQRQLGLEPQHHLH